MVILTGTSGNDRPTGTSAADTVQGLAGNDILGSRAEIDTLYGDAGLDLVSGGDAPDRIWGDVVSGALFDSSHAIACALAVDFESHRPAYLRHDYSEMSLRTDFLDKLLTGLGWDVGHIVQKNPFKQEVKVERPVKDNGAKRRADYAFFIASNYRDPRLLVEAKKPSANIATKDNYFQAIRYGWSSQIPVVALTNFEQTHVLDCRLKPDIDTVLDRAVRRYSLSDFKDKDRFAEIYFLLSREAVGSGSIEDFAVNLPKPRGKAVQKGLFKGGYQRMDRTFLAELGGHREVLALSLKQTNPALDGHALTEITQRILDRLIFIRFLEDKLIEQSPLVAHFGDRGSVWGDFLSACRRLDAVYNGLVFKRHPILDAPKFVVDDSMFGGVCEDLAHINSPYDFNSIPIHILGSIYERFLGSVITVEGKKAQLEEKPEVRKAGGVYYTPEYVVQYIVRETVGRRIAGKSPRDIAQMRFCDIACGSGSFLLGVFQVLIEEHCRWYNDNPDRANKDGCLRGEDGAWYLSLRQKRAILENNIYGVDLDPQAVEVAQVSLYLKLLEDETTASARQYELDMRETLLPTLSKNIICGNSLIEHDILEGDIFGKDEERKLNPCDLTNAFKRVIDEGGFDVIVGNPPYVRPHHVPIVQKRYFWSRWSVYTGKADIYTCFVQRSTGLLKRDGTLSYILSHGWLRLDSFKAMRQHILDHYRVVQLVELPNRVFEDAAVGTGIFLFQKESSKAARTKNAVQFIRCEEAKPEPVFVDVRRIPQKAFAASPTRVFDTSISPETEAVKAKMRGGPLIGEMYDVKFGLKTGDDGKFIHRTKGLYKEDKPLLRGEDVERYGFRWKGEYVWYVPTRMTAHRSTARPGEPARFEQPKVLVKDTTKQFACAYEPGDYYVKDVLVVIPKPDGRESYDLRFIAGVINSTALRFFYRTTYTTLHVQNGELAALPLPKVDLTTPDGRAKHDALVGLVEKLIRCRAALVEAQTEAESVRLGNWCDSLDARIEQAVDHLYGLSPADRKVADTALRALDEK